jgi:hypothetical protein
LNSLFYSSEQLSPYSQRVFKDAKQIFLGHYQYNKLESSTETAATAALSLQDAFLNHRIKGVDSKEFPSASVATMLEVGDMVGQRLIPDERLSLLKEKMRILSRSETEVELDLRKSSHKNYMERFRQDNNRQFQFQIQRCDQLEFNSKVLAASLLGTCDDANIRSYFDVLVNRIGYLWTLQLPDATDYLGGRRGRPVGLFRLLRHLEYYDSLVDGRLVQIVFDAYYEKKRENIFPLQTQKLLFEAFWIRCMTLHATLWSPKQQKDEIKIRDQVRIGVSDICKMYHRYGFPNNEQLLEIANLDDDDNNSNNLRRNVGNSFRYAAVKQTMYIVNIIIGSEMEFCRIDGYSRLPMESSNNKLLMEFSEALDDISTASCISRSKELEMFHDTLKHFERHLTTIMCA